jgi:hypothetical protein
MDQKMLKTLDKDPLLQQKVVDAVSDVHDDYVKDVQELIAQHDRIITTQKDLDQETVDEVKNRINKLTQGCLDIYVREADKAVVKGWKDLQNKQKSYANYQIKTVVNITTKSAFLVGNIALTATGGVGNIPGLVLGIAGAVKGTVDLAKTAYKAAVEAETVARKLTKTLNSLKASYKDSKAKLVAAELSKDIVNTFFLDIMPTISSCGDDLKLVEKKTEGIEVSAHKMSVKLNTILKAMSKVQKEIKATGNKSRKLPDLISHVGDLIDRISNDVGRVAKLQAQLDSLEKQLKVLESMKPQALQLFEKGLVFADAGIAAIQGDFKGIAISLAQVGTDLTVDKLLD